MPKCVLNEMVSTHALIEQVPDEVSSEEETSITVPDLTLIVWLQEKDLSPSMLPKSCMLCG
jgi:hypothetical protein